MDLYVLDKNYERIAIIDQFISLIWTERFNTYGDFELYLPADIEVVKLIKEDYYLELTGSDTYMIIECLETDTSSKEHDTLIVTGRTLEAILLRRIIWDVTNIEGKLQNGIKKLLNDNVISPSISGRKIPNFIFSEISDSRLNSMEMTSQYWGETVYEAIGAKCVEHDVGFRVRPYGNGGFNATLYFGIDRSYNQTDTYPVVFSPNYDNLKSSDYVTSKNQLKTHAMIKGTKETIRETETDEDGKEIVVAEYDVQYKTDASIYSWVGLDRRETFVDASSLQIEDGDDSNRSTYLSQLKDKGKEELEDTDVTEVFDGEVENTSQFVLGVDYFMGDIVQIEDKYGHQAKARITEIIRSINTTGVSIYPSFTKIEED